MPNKEELIESFQDTISYINSSKKLLKLTETSIKNTKIISEKVNNQQAVEDKKASITVVKDTSFNVARRYCTKGTKTAVLNFASAVNPGGGVIVGAMAQEECLCRSSNLLLCLNQKSLLDEYYVPNRKSGDNMNCDKVIYSPSVVVFKDDKPIPELLPEEQWIAVDIISSAAPNLRKVKQADENELFDIYCDRIDLILDTACANGAVNIVLGAWGCGVFKNSPHLVSKAFRKVITEKYFDSFDNIIFAIKDDKKDNFNVFGETFAELMTDKPNIEAQQKDNTEHEIGFCRKCGNKIYHNNKYCMHCGAKVIAAVDSKEIIEPAPVVPNDDNKSDFAELIDNRYKLLRQVGKGASSTVYLGQDIKLNRVCAVKIIDKNTYFDCVVADETLDEANKLKMLAHISIPQLYDIYDDERKLCVVMEYIEGNTLSEVIKESENPIDETIIIDWSIQLCEVLNYLHTMRPPRIFRDMKPANIILQPNGNIKLIDFGTLKIYDESCTEDTVNLGTKGYAAPEQYGGRGQTDARTDIYGLGMTMFHLITGINPAIPSLEIKSVSKYRKNISPDLEKIILKCIEIERENRYQSVKTLKRDLEKLIEK